VLREQWDEALLFRDLATLRATIPLFESVDTLLWTAPRPEFDAIGKRLDAAVVSRERPPRKAL
jgi:hypothetical protein